MFFSLCLFVICLLNILFYTLSAKVLELAKFLNSERLALVCVIDNQCPVAFGSTKIQQLPV